MDLLNNLLLQAGLRSRILGYRSFDSAMTLEFPCSKSIGFHAVTQGCAYIYHGQKKIMLKRGDIAFMARGINHFVSTEESLPKKITALKDFSQIPSSLKKSKLTLVSGAYQLWNTPLHPLFAEIPDWFVFRQEEIESYDKLNLMIGLLSEEVSQGDLGSERVIQGILDILFSLILRKIVKLKSTQTKTWSHASQDAGIKLALEVLHSDLTKNWTLEDLAKKVGLSRAGFALKFKKSMGDTPLHYLTLLRIQSAMELLSTTSDNIETVAAQVGYQDAFSFSKAFKRIVGLPPKEFKLRDLEDRKKFMRVE